MQALRDSGFSVFAFREYRLFWIAAAFSNIGMWTLVYGRLWVMRSLTDSEFLLGLVASATLAPVILLTLWGGVIADRVNRLQLLRFTRFLFAAAGLLTGVLLALDMMEVWHLLAISSFTGILLAFDIPARSAMVAALVPKKQLPSAISLYSVVFGGAAILGPAMFHPMVSIVGMEGLFYLISASYVLTVLALWMMDDRLHNAATDGNASSDERDDDADNFESVVQSGMQRRLQELVDGLKYVRAQPVIAAVIFYGIAIGLLASPFETLLPVMTEEVFRGGTETYGQLLLSVGIGGIVATLAITLIGARANPPQYLAIGGGALGICMVFFSLVERLEFALPIATLIGLFTVFKSTMSTTVVQTLVSDEYRGRVMSLMMFTWGAQAMGALLSGALAEWFGAPFALLLSGFAALISALLVWRLALRRLAWH